MSSDAKGKRLFFINKSQHSDSLSKSLPKEQAAIQSFVQTGRKRSRKIRGTKTVTTKCTTYEASNETEQPESTSKQAQGSCVRQHDKAVVPREPDAQNGRRDYSQPNAPSHIEPILLPTLVCHNISSGQDPFGTASVTINKPVADLLNYYVYYYHPSQWPNEMALLQHGVYVYQESVSNTMKNAMVDPLVMSCILGAAACRLQFVDRIPCAQVKGTENHHIRRAVQLLAAALVSTDLQDYNQLDRFVTCMVLLIAAESYRSDIGAANVHLDTMRWLLNLRGGPTAINDECLRGQIAMSDLATACFEIRSCHFGCCYDPGPASLLGLSASEMQGAPISCTAASLLHLSETFIPLNLQQLIRDVLESYTVKTRATMSSMSAKRALKITRWLTIRNMAIRNKLLAIKTADPKVHALRVTLVMWTLLSMSITGRAKTTKVMAPKLKSILSEIPSCEWKGNESIHLWILLVGAQSVAACSTEAIWFVGNCFSLILSNHDLWPNSAMTCASELQDRLVTFQNNFLYDTTVQRSRTQALAQTLHNSVG